jgi:hypothetical protein
VGIYVSSGGVLTGLLKGTLPPMNRHKADMSLFYPRLSAFIGGQFAFRLFSTSGERA